MRQSWRHLGFNNGVYQGVSEVPTYCFVVWHELQTISSEVLWAREELGEGTPQVGAPGQEAMSLPDCWSLSKLRGTLFHLLLEKGGKSISSQIHHGEHHLTL